MSVKLHHSGSGDYGTHGVQNVYFFHCPGCGNAHAFHVPRWTWNGSMDLPTFSPSLLCNPDHAPSRYHSFVRDGKIQFLSDCHHTLAGQTVEIPDWEGW